MKSRLLAGAAAVVLAIVGAMLVISYAQGADQRAVKNLEPVAVLVVKTAIPAGTPVESMTASVATEQLPAAAVLALPSSPWTGPRARWPPSTWFPANSS